MSYIPSLESLPSAAYRAHIEASLVQIADEKLLASTRDEVLKGLGALGLGLAHRPVGQWIGSRDELARLFAGWTQLEATTMVEIAADAGLLMTAADGRLYPKTPHLFTWLGARTTWLTQDAVGYMDERMRGGLWDIYAMAPAFEPDAGTAAGLVQLLAERDGPWEGLLELAPLLAAEAVAWGADVTETLRGELLEKAVAWTMPEGKLSHMNGATALLAAEARGGPFASFVLEGTRDRVESLVEAMKDPDLAAHPRILASLDAALTTLAAPADDVAFEGLFMQVPGHADRVVSAAARAYPRGPERDELLVYLVSQAVALESYGALGVLGHLERPHEGAVDLVGAALQMVIDEPTDGVAQRAAQAACEAVAQWREVPEGVAYLMARAVIAPVEPEVRISAAGALSSHPEHLAPVASTLLETLEANFSLEDAVVRAGVVGAALHLATADAGAAALAIGLISDGVPLSLLGPPLDAGLRRSPPLAGGLASLWGEFAEDVPMTIASLLTLGEISEVEAKRLEAGPYAEQPPLPEVTHQLIVAYLRAMAQDMSEPLRAAEAGVTLGWLLRGDTPFAESMLAGRRSVHGESEKIMFNLALGACGVPSEAIIEHLARDASDGTEAVAMGAAGALRVLLQDVMQADPIAPFLGRLEARAHTVGDESEAMTELLHFLATRPTGAL